MGNINPKCKLVVCHSLFTGLVAIGALVYGIANFIGALKPTPELNDDSCVKFALRGAEDITALNNNIAYIGSDDRENWLIKQNINQDGVEKGKITRISDVGQAVFDNEYADIEPEDMLAGSGFPNDIDFHPHGMSITPDWVSETDKQLMVINHAWKNGGERIEIFDIEDDKTLTWRRAIGELQDGEELKDSLWQTNSYGAFNGLTVVGKDEVLLGKWMNPVYIVPGADGYTDDQQMQVLNGNSKIVWAKYVDPSSYETPDGVESDGNTRWEVLADGFALAKSVAVSNDGTKAYVTDTIMSQIVEFDYDKDARTMTKTGGVFTTQGNLDNLKRTEGTDNILGGYMASIAGNLQFEVQRQGQTWDNVTNVPENIGGAEELRMNEDGVLESRVLINTNKINGFSNAAKVGNNIVIGSWIDPNYLVCPYDDSIEWKSLQAPKGSGGFIAFILVILGLQLTLFCYQWRKINEDQYKSA